MFCVQSVTFSIKINGAAKGHISPSQRLCQGDFLSPYLFPVVIEGLIALLTEAKNKKLIQGIKICRAAPSISHLLFVYDSLIFYSVDLVENKNLIDLLALYECASRQFINKEKTSLNFKNNIPSKSQRAIKNLWGTNDTQKDYIYLGLPAIVGKSQHRVFSEIK